jgi:Ca-activated chloride channel family protein
MKKKTLIVGLSMLVLSLGVAARGGSAEVVNSVTVKTQLDRPVLVRGGGEQEVVIKVTIAGGKVVEVEGERAPLNLAVVLDRSGSMTGAKIEKAKQAAMMLVDELGQEDVISLVVYDSDVDVIASAQRVGGRQAQLKRLIQRIGPGGSTALYAGVKCAGDQLAEFLDEEAINRVLLLSDGIANVGPKSNREITRLGQHLAGRGMSVSTIGLGDDYNEDLMTALAESSDANYYFVDDVEMLAEVFESELGELKSVVARKLIVEIEFPDGVKPVRFLGREESFDAKGNKGTIQFEMLAGGQQRDLLVLCRVAPKSTGDAENAAVASVNVRYQDTQAEGKLRKVTARVTAELSDDADLAEKKIDAVVRAEAEVFNNADVSRAAIKLADSGDVKAAEKTIDSQIVHLRSVQSAAPEAQQQLLEAEIDALAKAQSDIGSAGKLSSGSRKNLQWRVYNRSNAKNLDTPAKK